MAPITIDIPDDLAQWLAPFQSQFSDLPSKTTSAHDQLHPSSTSPIG